MIVYFTGTGNSRYIANILARQLGDNAVDAAELIKDGKFPEFTSEKSFVFVSPVYAWRFPRVFEKWMRKCRFMGNENAYFVMTCGDSIGAADIYMESVCDDINLEYMGTADVVMPENYLIMFDPTPAEDDLEIISKAQKRTRELALKISSGEAFDKVKASFVGYLESGIVNSCFYTFYIGAKKFYATDDCISCGKCVKNCMLNNITMKEGRPEWGKDCTHCMACICHCPTEAIEYGNKTKGRRRYLCSAELKEEDK